jgi:hypothetical protein
MSVKSDRPMRPVGCSWRKITSRLGPLKARHLAIRRPQGPAHAPAASQDAAVHTSAAAPDVAARVPSSYGSAVGFDPVGAVRPSVMCRLGKRSSLRGKKCRPTTPTATTLILMRKMRLPGGFSLAFEGGGFGLLEFEAGFDCRSAILLLLPMV